MISICIPTYNRTDLLFESYSKVIDDPRVSEIVIVDDCSTDQVWVKMCNTIRNHPKIKLYRNEKNLDCYRNKREAVSKATNEWVIILDSDNIIDINYIDKIFAPKQIPISGHMIPENHFTFDTIYQPSFAKPHFNFKKYEGMLIMKDNVSKYVNDPTFTTMLNAFNLFVNRDEYLRVWDGNVDPVTSDSIYFNYKWLEAGNSIYVVPGMEYEHRVHEGSHYKNNVRRTPKGFHESVIQKLKQLK